jgi:ribosomal protein L37E
MTKCDHIFTCRRCEANYHVDSEQYDCPVCGWLPKENVDLFNMQCLGTRTEEL